MEKVKVENRGRKFTARYVILLDRDYAKLLGMIGACGENYKY
jgi:hypothetical protein